MKDNPAVSELGWSLASGSPSAAAQRKPARVLGCEPEGPGQAARRSKSPMKKRFLTSTFLALSLSCALAASASAQSATSGARSTDAGNTIAGGDPSSTDANSSMAMMFDKWDTDHNGSISKQEFMTGVAAMHSAGTGATGTEAGTTTGTSGIGTSTGTGTGATTGTAR